MEDLIRQLRERADAIGMDSLKSGTRPEVAIFGDIANELTLAADALEAATSAPAVDREALVERVDGSALDHFLKSLNGDEAGDVDYVWAEDGNTGWVMRGGNDVASVLLAAVDALLASGVLRDVRDVQAEALERYADERWGTVGPRRKELNSMFAEELRIREAAQAIREAPND